MMIFKIFIRFPNRPMSCHIHYRERQRSRLVVTALIAAAVILLLALDLATGSSGIPLEALLASLAAGPSADNPQALILWELRLPMSVTALFVGASLSLAGLSIQTITANALASPSTLGITSGASFGAALAITSGFTLAGELWTIYLASPETAQLINGWTFGNLERAGWLSAAAAGGALLAGVLLLAPAAWQLTTLSVGEERAKSLGVPVAKLRILVFAVSSILVAAAVSFIGTIAFVGLVAPHCAKLLLGDDQRWLIPGSILAGGFIMLLSSLIAKWLSAGAMLPIGIVTSIAGVPFLLVLLLKSRRDF